MAPSARRFFVLAAFAAGVLLTACEGGGALHGPAQRNLARSIPAAPTAAIPAAPQFAAPSGPRLDAVRRSPSANHSAFFGGEVSLGNGVYYLQFPNSNLFGYYAYLSDTHYIYHYDLGYQYIFDTADANNVYIYDFGSGHFWYTGKTLFPYVYDFSLLSFLYYYPDSQKAGHYTSNPRWFFDFQTGQIIAVPIPPPIPLLLNVTVSWANTANSASSFALSLDVYDANHTLLAHTLKTESSIPTGSGVRQMTTDNISASYPQGLGATYQLTVNGGGGVASPCTMTGGSGNVVDASSGNGALYPTVALTCN